MNLGLSYAVIRSHALIADLLTPKQIQALSKLGTVEAFINALSNTSYGEISLEEDRDPSISLERAFYKKLIERMTKIVEISPERIGEFLQAYYYLRFEVLNLVRIMRGKFSEQPVPQIMELLVPMEPYKVNDYQQLSEVKDLEEAVKLLRNTPYAAVESSLAFCKEYDALWPLELALNHIYAEAVTEALKKLSRKDQSLVRNILKFEVDVENLLNAIKHQRTRKNESREYRLEELFPVIYDINLEKIKSIIEAEDIKSIIKDLGEPYSDILSPIYEGDIAYIRARVRRHIYTTVQNARSTNDFGFNVIMAYMIFSELEVDDLVGIAWGITQGIPSEDIMKYLAVSQ